jgi:hypothetical protein
VASRQVKRRAFRADSQLFCLELFDIEKKKKKSEPHRPRFRFTKRHRVKEIGRISFPMPIGSGCPGNVLQWQFFLGEELEVNLLQI